jgi:extradiol dioxygenase family protein
MLIGIPGIPDQPSIRRVARARLVGINHVALEVGDLDAALEFYGRFFSFELRGRVPGMAFLEMGDQFLAVSEGRRQAADDDRHFGLVVDDREAVRAALKAAGVPTAPVRGLRFADPWGNNVEVVDYRDIQFTKAPGVAAGMGLEDLEKSDQALRELAEKGLSPPT